MSAASTSPLNLVPATPTYRPYQLKCRFTVWAAPCHARISPLLPLCPHLEHGFRDAGGRFVEDMRRQGWTWLDGRLTLSAGPIPLTPVETSSLPAAVTHRPLPWGPHPRFGPAYDTPVVGGNTVTETDAWEYEITGWFARHLPATIASVDAISALEATQQRRGRGQRTAS